MSSKTTLKWTGDMSFDAAKTGAPGPNPCSLHP